ncbi:MAG TPA: DoxX family protein [Bryocella sp.]|nr:DoxX family protein [Bryocella sp.]
MAELRLASEEQTGGLGEWLVRFCVALPFLIFGLEKFGNDAHWVRMFREIGWGAWFRYFTGGVEVLGAVLVMDGFYPGVRLVGVVGVGLWWWEWSVKDYALRPSAERKALRVEGDGEFVLRLRSGWRRMFDGFARFGS